MEVVETESYYVVELNKWCYLKLNTKYPEEAVYGITADLGEAARFSSIGSMYRYETPSDIARKFNGKVRRLTHKMILEDVE